VTLWLAAFAITQLVEVPIYFLAQDGERPWPQRLCLAFGASAVTHPFVWYLFPELIHPWWLMVVAAESFAVLVEAGWFAVFGLRKALLWALVANGTSVCVGFVLQWLGVF
jgi:hypothetical protein